MSQFRDLIPIRAHRRLTIKAILAGVLLVLLLPGQGQAQEFGTTFTVEGGVGMMRLGTVQQSTSGRVRLGGAATFAIGKLDIGPGLSVAFQRLEYQDRDGQSKETFVSALANVLARYQFHQSYAVSGELGVGALLIDTFNPGNAFVEGGQRLKDPSFMPQFRAALGIERVLSRKKGLHMSLAPGFSYTIADKRFVSEVSSITTFHLMIGLRTAPVRTSAR